VAPTAAMTETDFDFVRRLVYQRSAIVLEPGKEYLVESRLAPIVRDNGLGSISELVGKLRGPGAALLERDVIEAMTTNETSFFRDLWPFEVLKADVLPDLIAKRQTTRTLTIWCAASSTGQEPYSISMLIREHFPALGGWNVKILATDLSSEVLEKAKEARYSQLEVGRGMPAALLVKYFERHGLDWQLKPEIRRSVEFRQMNLAEPWPALPPADLVMVRNVLIYFDTDTKKAILGKVRGVLKNDGYMFLGAAETTLNLDEGFERLQFQRTGCYRLRAS
jgi:chemotaxis protein methyltransferase CheR